VEDDEHANAVTKVPEATCPSWWGGYPVCDDRGYPKNFAAHPPQQVASLVVYLPLPPPVAAAEAGEGRGGPDGSGGERVGAGEARKMQALLRGSQEVQAHKNMALGTALQFFLDKPPSRRRSRTDFSVAPQRRRRTAPSPPPLSPAATNAATGDDGARQRRQKWR
jgi:hypothetical protein